MTKVDTTVDTAVDTAVDTKDLAKRLGAGISQAVLLYLPVLKTMAMKELAAVAVALDRERYDDAMKIVLDAMTAADLARQKKLLATRAAEMADERAKQGHFVTELTGAILKAAMNVLFAAAVF